MGLVVLSLDFLMQLHKAQTPFHHPQEQHNHYQCDQELAYFPPDMLAFFLFFY